ncbi:MAG TPA: helix-turn-helix domain-containing protein [Aldersonia sp.]
MTSDADVDRLIRKYVATRLTRDESEVAQVVARLNDEVFASVPLLATDRDLRHALDASTRGQIREFLAWLAAEPTEPKAAAEAVEFARLLARRGVDSTVLLRVNRFGQQASLNEIIVAMRNEAADPLVRQGAAVTLLRRALDWLNACIEQLIGAYASERESWLRSAIARRADLIETILHGDVVDIDDAGRVLGHNLRVQQTALELWFDDDANAPDGAERLDALAGRLAAGVRAPRPLVVSSGRQSISVWLATLRPPDVRRLTTTRAERGIRVAIGMTAVGVSGFVSSHREALTARRTAMRLPPRSVVRYADVELLSLTSQDLSAARRFVAHELGDLASPDDATARIRETVQVYLAHGVGEAADQLGVHRNTVRYRLQQAEVLLGHGVDERRLPVELALYCVGLDPTLLEPAADV